MGATTKKDVSKSIDCLIISTQVYPDLVSTSYGRKIQKAIELSNIGHPLVIMTGKYRLTFFVGKQMTEQEFHKQIDADASFNKIKKLLITLSSLILFITFSGAVVKEANTFIFKIEFMHSSGLLILFGLANTYAFIRYINFSGPYFIHLRDFWVNRFLHDPKIKVFDSHSDQYGGALAPILNSWFEEHYDSYQRQEIDPPTYNYKSSLIPFFGRYIEFHSVSSRYDFDIYDSKKISQLGFLPYLYILTYEFIYRVRAFIFHREPMDIYPPIYLYIGATLSIFFKSEIRWLVKLILPA